MAEAPSPFLSAERLKFFTDAVVAIALTLLVLPLLEAVPEVAKEHQSLREWLDAHTLQLISFTNSFITVGIHWVFHHRIFAHIEHPNRRLIFLSFAWMFNIAFFQVPSALVYQVPITPTMIVLYVGSMALSMLLLTLMAWTAFFNPALQVPEYPLSVRDVGGVLGMALLYTLIMLLAIAFPQVNYGMLFLLFLGRWAAVGATRLVSQLPAVRRQQAGQKGDDHML